MYSINKVWPCICGIQGSNKMLVIDNNNSVIVTHDYPASVPLINYEISYL